MFRRVLIANRGEIALRVLRACRALGCEVVVVYSEADRNARYVSLADEAVCIGPPPARSSYLDINRVIAAAEITDADAIHPGYGFLSENAKFVEVVAACGFTFIGPPAEVISKLGDKNSAKAIARAAGVPTVPGSDGLLPSAEAALETAERVGYPVMIKATAGGGGRGMRLVRTAAELPSLFEQARSEAGAAFNNPDVYLEKFVEGPRHVEIQVLADGHGHIVHLGERECSVQRRHQKLLEESPSPALSPELREAMGEAAVALCRQAGYVNAGTVEFLVDRHRNFYFMEVNTRVQVEHPVTEMVTGTDIVQEQIRVAAGQPLSFTQADVTWSGAAIECRINAEDSLHGFRPSCGTITRMEFPGGSGVRFDTHAFGGYAISPFYDSMIGKLVVHAPTRARAIAAMQRALDECVIEGISTTVPFHKRILADPRFVSGDYDTSFIATMQEALPAELRP
ncbi:MAG TPA: acetyl-CoA carboxylase biotin carboxylase subunit [Planctomycetota bacterium]|nr:acetyl-CoA carboxylase biotin carboxylase subunit [Planctomycetota bacterium]